MPLLLLAALLSSWARAFPVCFDPKAAPEKAPESMDALRVCQGKKRAAFVKNLKRKPGKDVPPAVLERLDAFQRKEAGAYAATHTEGEEPTADAEKPKDGDLGDLKELLRQQSDDGKRGVTPEMAREIIGNLEAKQGFVSPEMQDLLKHLSADGSRLSHASVRRLKTATQAAKKEGLDLGVPADIEKFLLESAEETPDDPTGPNYDAVAPPTN